MTTSKNFNIDSYEAKMIRSQLSSLQDDMESLKILIKDQEYKLKTYIDKKEWFYKKIRALREDKK